MVVVMRGSRVYLMEGPIVCVRGKWRGVVWGGNTVVRAVANGLAIKGG